MRDLTPTEMRMVKKAVRDAYEKGRAAERREFDAFLSRMRALKELNGSADSFLKAYSPGERAKGRAVEMEHTADPAEAARIAEDHLDEDPAYYSKLDAAGLADGGKDDNPHDLVAEAMLAHAEESLSTGADPLPGLDRLRDLLDDPAALADLLGQSGADDATVGKCFRVLKAWDESKHPRGKGGHFISKDRIEAAKTDPKLAKELRKEVKPEDAGKLDAALEGKTDLGRTKRGQAKHEAAGRRATKDEAKAKTQEFIKHFQKVGDLKADLTADHLYDLAEHLKSEHVTIDDVRQLRTALHGAGGGKASFGGQRKRQALVDALRDHARGRGLKERAKELGLDGGELSAAVGTRDAGEPAPAAGAAGGRQAPATTGQYGAWGRAAAGEGAPTAAPGGEGTTTAAEKPGGKETWGKPLELALTLPTHANPLWFNGMTPPQNRWQKFNVSERPDGTYDVTKTSDQNPAGVHVSAGKNASDTMNEIWRAGGRWNTNGEEYQDAVRRGHRSAVESALAAGKPVPPEVLADYPDLAPAPPAAPAATPPAPAPTTGVAADEAELAALNRTPAKKLTPAQKKRKDQLSREFTARKFPGATPVMTGGGKGPGVSDAENESTAAKPSPPATTVDTPAGADYSSGTPALGTGGTSGGAKVEANELTAAQKFNRQPVSVGQPGQGLRLRLRRPYDEKHNGTLKAKGWRYDRNSQSWTLNLPADLADAVRGGGEAKMEALRSVGAVHSQAEIYDEFARPLFRGVKVPAAAEGAAPSAAAKKWTATTKTGSLQVGQSIRRKDGTYAIVTSVTAPQYSESEMRWWHHYDTRPATPEEATSLGIAHTEKELRQAVRQAEAIAEDTGDTRQLTDANQRLQEHLSARIQGVESPPPAPGGTPGGGKVEATTKRPAEPAPAAAPAAVPAGHTPVHTFDGGGVTAKDPKTGHVVTYFPPGAPEKAAEKLHAALAAEAADAVLFNGGTTSTAEVVGAVQARTGAQLGEILAAMKHMRDTGVFQFSHMLHGAEVAALEKGRGSSLALPGAKGLNDGFLWDKGGSPLVSFWLPRPGMSADDIVSEYRKSTNPVRGNKA